jgi:hypothetical protein
MNNKLNTEKKLIRENRGSKPLNFETATSFERRKYNSVKHDESSLQVIKYLAPPGDAICIGPQRSA